MLTVAYKNVVIDGQTMPHNTTLAQPAIQLKRKPNILYTLIMTNADAEPPTLHWLVVNIDRANYQDVVPYYPPPTPPNGKTHNYVFHLCEQPKGLRLAPISGRSGFNAQQFIMDYHLTLVDRKMFKATTPW